MGTLALVPAAVVVAAGVWAGGQWLRPPCGPWLIGLVPLWLLAWRLAPRRRCACANLLPWVVLGACALGRGVSAREWMAAQRAPLGDQERLIRCRGRVASYPTWTGGTPRAVVECEAAEPGLRPGTRLELDYPAGTDLAPGRRLTLLARAQIPPGQRNPGSPSARERAAHHGIAAAGRAFVARSVTVSYASGPWAWRQALATTLARRLTQRNHELLLPLVLGDWSPVAPATASDLRRAGLTHLLALSGMHVSWFASLARILGAAMRLPLPARQAAGPAAALFYWLVAGNLPSLARAAVGELCGSVARLAGRALDPRQALALSVIALLACFPGWVGDPGFQLSCAATAGLVCFGAAIQRSLGARRVPGVALFLPTASAQLGALPWLVAHFHAVSVAGFAANLVAVPLSSLMLGAAWLGLALEAAWAPLATPCFDAAQATAEALRWVAQASASPREALWVTGHDPKGMIALLAGIGFLLHLARPSPTLEEQSSWNPPGRIGTSLVALSLTVAGGLLALSAPALRPPPGRVWAVFLDVGQGDACALGFPDGEWWLVDAGPRSPRGDAGESVVLPFLRWAGVRRLDALVLTHADSDHTGGAGAVLRALAVRRILVPAPSPSTPGPAAALHGRAGVRAVARGSAPLANPPVLVLWPPVHEEDGLQGDNRRCLVLRVDGTLLLSGDVDSLVERSLRGTGPAWLLKVAHHGSGGSTSEAWLSQRSPRWAVISCGAHNPFGHPRPAIEERLRRAGACLWRTDRRHAAWFEGDGSGWQPLEWRGGSLRPLRLGAAAGNHLARAEPAQ